MSRIDLHTHSTASDGEVDPTIVVQRAAAVGLTAVALTDHDTTAGIPAACAEGHHRGVRVVSGCEFSVGVSWGEMHLLAYFLPIGDARLQAFLAEQRHRRVDRADEIVEKLRDLGMGLERADLVAQVQGNAIGRPHVAKALVAVGAVDDVQAAFDRYLGAGRPAFVPKTLPPLETVTGLVRGVGGVTSAAHLGARATGALLEQLREMGVDGVEARHPAHSERTAKKIERLASTKGLLLTGGSDWHGDGKGAGSRGTLGDIDVPCAWLDMLEALHVSRIHLKEASP